MSDSLATADPAVRHRVISGGFADVVAAVTDWEAPTPVADWAARDVVAHLVDWFPEFLRAGGIDLAAGPAVAQDPVGAWRAQSAGVQALLDGPAAEDTFRHPMAGEHRLADAIDRFYTADIFMHTWDLATAAGVDPRLDEGFASMLLDGMAGIEDILRGSGQYGPRVEVADDASAVDRLIGFIGRDPDWHRS